MSSDYIFNKRDAGSEHLSPIFWTLLPSSRLGFLLFRVQILPQIGAGGRAVLCVYSAHYAQKNDVCDPSAAIIPGLDL